MTDLVTRAMQFAHKMHKGQMYGRQPYVAHLASVVSVLLDFGYEEDEDLLAAAWLHDVIEDQDVSYKDIALMFGANVGMLVWSVSGEGTNRKARNASIYNKIDEWPRAAILKLADRIANVEQSVAGSKHFNMYLTELPEFSKVIHNHVSPGMWHRLERAFVRAEEAA